MTPKEKAQELVEVFWIEVEDNEYPTRKMSLNQAKQCALITVDEVMHSLEIYFTEPIPEAFTVMSLRNHWQEVKQEIINL